MTDQAPASRLRRSARHAALLASAAVIMLGIAVEHPWTRETASAARMTTPVRAQPVPHQPGFAEIVAKVKPAVVSVQVKLDEAASAVETSSQDGDDASPHQPGKRGEFVTAVGSGFFISSDGYLVTNHHVVDHARTVQVTTDAGQTYSAKVIGTDKSSDLALLKVDASDLPYVSFADEAPRIGDWVVAVGNPFGLGGTVTAGIVSARGRDIGSGPYDDYIQIDAPINRGNSGGPAFNVDGKVVGVNTAIYSPSGGSVGIGFDIPAGTVKRVVQQLKENGHVTRGWLGVQAQAVTAEIAESLGLSSARGALVDEPQPDSPAAKAGIKAGDVITAVNGAAVDNSHDLARTIAQIAPGTSVRIGVRRDGDERSIQVTLGTLPAERQAQVHKTEAAPSARGGRLGLTIAPADKVAGAGNRGAVVTAVEPAGVASEHGVQVGDVILRVGSADVAGPADVRTAIATSRKQGKHAVLMQVKSGDATRFVALPLG